MMQRKHPGEAMTGEPGALPGEAIRPLILIVAAHLEHPHRSALENHVHRSPRVGRRRSANLRIGITQGHLVKDLSSGRRGGLSWHLAYKQLERRLPPPRTAFQNRFISPSLM